MWTGIASVLPQWRRIPSPSARMHANQDEAENQGKPERHGYCERYDPRNPKSIHLVLPPPHLQERRIPSPFLRESGSFDRRIESEPACGNVQLPAEVWRPARSFRDDSRDLAAFRSVRRRIFNFRICDQPATRQIQWDRNGSMVADMGGMQSDCGTPHGKTKSGWVLA